MPVEATARLFTPRSTLRLRTVPAPFSDGAASTCQTPVHSCSGREAPIRRCCNLVPSLWFQIRLKRGIPSVACHCPRRARCNRLQFVHQPLPTTRARRRMWQCGGGDRRRPRGSHTRLRRLPVFFSACNDALTGFSGTLLRAAQIRSLLQLRFLTRIFVGFVVQRGFTGGDVLAAESVVYEVLSTPEKRLYCTQQVRGHRSSPRV